MVGLFLPPFGKAPPNCTMAARFHRHLAVEHRPMGSLVPTMACVVIPKRPMSTFTTASLRHLERLYASPEVARRRNLVVEHMQPLAGESVLDIGCGPGHLTRDLALAVGSSGVVAAIDADIGMLSETRSRCENLPHVGTKHGEAEFLPFQSAAFSRVASVQVFEYVRDVDAAFGELRRCMRSDGVAVVVATDWTSLRWERKPSDVGKDVRAAFLAHSVHEALPNRLASLAGDNGLKVDQTARIDMRTQAFGPSSYAAVLLDIATSFVAIHQPDLEPELDAWRLGVQRNFAFDLQQVLFRLTPAEPTDPIHAR